MKRAVAPAAAPLSACLVRVVILAMSAPRLAKCLASTEAAVATVLFRFFVSRVR